jgi:hypothetical protein
MATTSGHDYRPVVESRSDTERSPGQVAREAALHEVEETLLNIEQAIKRADRAAGPSPAGSFTPLMSAIGLGPLTKLGAKPQVIWDYDAS